MAAFGFSLNNLSLFGLVLAIGIVVDDAIVVVENVERNIGEGLEPERGLLRTMDEVGGALIAIALVLTAVFVPVGVHHRHLRSVLPPVRADDRGRDGHFAHRFADAVAGAVRPAAEAAHARSTGIALVMWPIQLFFRPSTGASTSSSQRLRLARRPAACASRVVMLVVYAGIIAFGLNEFRKTPIGFIPAVDRGYLHHRGAAAAGAPRWRARTRSTGAPSSWR